MRQRLISDDQQRSALCGVLRSARVRKGLKQAEVASRLDQPQSFVSKYEGGGRRLDLIELLAVCAALDIDVRTLLDELETSLSKEHVA